MNKVFEAQAAIRIDHQGIALKRFAEYVSLLEQALKGREPENLEPLIEDVGEGSSEKSVHRLLTNSKIVTSWARTLGEEGILDPKDQSELESAILPVFLLVEALSASPDDCVTLLIDESYSASAQRAFAVEDNLKLFQIVGALLGYLPDETVENVLLAYLQRLDQMAASNYYRTTHRSVYRTRYGPCTVADGAGVGELKRPRIWLADEDRASFVEHTLDQTKKHTAAWSTLSTQFLAALEKHLNPYPQVMYFSGDSDVTVRSFPIFVDA